MHPLQATVHSANEIPFIVNQNFFSLSYNIIDVPLPMTPCNLNDVRLVFALFSFLEFISNFMDCLEKKNHSAV